MKFRSNSFQEQILPRLRHIAKSESLKLTEDGERALMKLAGGDMRRVLNILQVISLLKFHGEIIYFLKL